MYLTTALTMIGARTSALTAQREPASGAIDGIVTDTTLAPLADASASILASNIKVTTGANGRFVINGLPAGEYVVLVRRVGYAAASQENPYINIDQYLNSLGGLQNWQRQFNAMAPSMRGENPSLYGGVTRVLSR